MPEQTITLKPIKRGDGFRRACVYKTMVDGVMTPTSLDGFGTIASQIRDSVGTLLGSLTVIRAPNQEDNPGVFTIEATPNPPDPAWPIDRLAFDIEFTVAGIPRSSWTIYLPVVPDETHG